MIISKNKLSYAELVFFIDLVRRCQHNPKILKLIEGYELPKSECLIEPSELEEARKILMKLDGNCERTEFKNEEI